MRERKQHRQQVSRRTTRHGWHGYNQRVHMLRRRWEGRRGPSAHLTFMPDSDCSLAALHSGLMSSLPTQDPALVIRTAWPADLPQHFSKKSICEPQVPSACSALPFTSLLVSRTISPKGKADLAERQKGPLTPYDSEARDVVLPLTRTLNPPLSGCELSVPTSGQGTHYV